jgi:BirA family transcriptional regulator, biotin operon repressor / biotin---[acetyl-CoA-carboxylase] ligase
MPDAFLDADQIRAATFVRHVEIHETLGSTNDRAIELARDPQIELPALIVARQQTAGRGRGKNAWWSAEGALTFSIVLEPAAMGISAANWPQLSLTTAVAVCDALSNEVPSGSLGIKWPNDVMLDGGKVCGILITSPGGGQPAKDRLSIGIGMNVNNSWHSAPRNLETRGTAVCDVTGRQHALPVILVNTLRALSEKCTWLAAGDSKLSASWQRLCWLTEQAVEWHDNSRWITGICVGTDCEGALLIENVDGVHRVFSGSVRVL